MNVLAVKLESNAKEHTRIFKCATRKNVQNGEIGPNGAPVQSRAARESETDHEVVPALHPNAAATTRKSNSADQTNVVSNPQLRWDNHPSNTYSKLLGLRGAITVHAQSRVAAGSSSDHVPVMPVSANVDPNHPTNVSHVTTSPATN